MYLMWFCV